MGRREHARWWVGCRQGPSKGAGAAFQHQRNTYFERVLKLATELQSLPQSMSLYVPFSIQEVRAVFTIVASKRDEVKSKKAAPDPLRDFREFAQEYSEMLGHLPDSCAAVMLNSQ